MSNIRKQSIKGTLWVYVGFAIGAIITLIFTNKNWFTTTEYGLTRSLLEFGILFASFSNLGSNLYLYKLFPYYKDNIENKHNDLLGTAIKIAAVGFVLTVIGLIIIQPFAFKKFNTNAPLLMEYFYLIIPIGFLYLLQSILEAYSYGFSKAVTISFLKEVALRIYTLVVILLKITGLINLTTFIVLFSLQYAVVVIILSYILYKENNLWLSFKTSYVTKKFKKNIINLLLLTYLTVVVTVLRSSIDTMMLAPKKGLDNVGIFGFVTYLMMAMQAPIRTLNNVTIPILSRCWKDKNLAEIARIYKRTSINLLAFALFVFILILLNYKSAITVLNLNESYLLGKPVFFILGIVTIIEFSTGVNGQIIGTSSFYRFELWTSILLTLLIIPLSYILTDKYGIIGPALANLVSFSIYNAARFFFLYKKFNMQPFSLKTLELLCIAAIAYVIIHFSIEEKATIFNMLFRSILFILLFCIPFYLRNISPDSKQIFETIKKRFAK